MGWISLDACYLTAAMHIRERYNMRYRGALHLHCMWTITQFFPRHQFSKKSERPEISMSNFAQYLLGTVCPLPKLRSTDILVPKTRLWKVMKTDGCLRPHKRMVWDISVLRVDYGLRTGSAKAQTVRSVDKVKSSVSTKTFIIPHISCKVIILVANTLIVPYT